MWLENRVLWVVLFSGKRRLLLCNYDVRAVRKRLYETIYSMCVSENRLYPQMAILMRKNVEPSNFGVPYLQINPYIYIYIVISIYIYIYIHTYIHTFVWYCTFWWNSARYVLQDSPCGAKNKNCVCSIVVMGDLQYWNPWFQTLNCQYAGSLYTLPQFGRGTHLFKCWWNSGETFQFN